MSKERDQFMVVMGREFPKLSAYSVTVFAGQLMRIGATQSRHSVALCNIPDYQETYNTATERNRKSLAKLFAEYEIKPLAYHLGGDPRGATLKLLLPSKAHNTMGGDEDGYAVPGS